MTTCAPESIMSHNPWSEGIQACISVDLYKLEYGNELGHPYYRLYKWIMSYAVHAGGVHSAYVQVRGLPGSKGNSVTTRKTAAEKAADTVVTNNESTDAVTAEPAWLVKLGKNGKMDDDSLREITSFEDAMRAAVELYGPMDSIAEHLGNGFTLLADKDKARLIGKSMIILQVSFNQGTYGRFASALVVTQDNMRLIVNDGSTGIYMQLEELTERLGRNGGFPVPHGFRVSQYPTCGSCDRPRPREMDCTFEGCQDPTTAERHQGETFYLDVSE